MKAQRVQTDEFHVIGVKTRTSVFEHANGGTKIRQLWFNFGNENIQEKIPGRLDNTVVAVYYDYEQSDELPYSLLVGAKVKPGTKPPPGMELVKVPKKTYAKFTTRKGEIPAIVMDAWESIWEKHISSEIQRDFGVDYEIYDQRAVDQRNSLIDIYVSVV